MTTPFITAQIDRFGPLDCVIHFRVTSAWSDLPNVEPEIAGMEVDPCHPDETALTNAERITLHNKFWDTEWHRVCEAAEAWLVEQREDAAQVRADDARNEMGAAA